LIWWQQIFTCSVYPKRPQEEKDLEPTMKLNFYATMARRATTSVFENGIMKLPEECRRCAEVQGECVENKYYFFKL
jgi:hypothetical protein